MPSKRQIMRQLGADGDGPESAQVPFQRMQPEAGQVHVVRHFGTVQNSKDIFYPFEQICPDLRPVPTFKKPFQTAMPKAPYHFAM